MHSLLVSAFGYNFFCLLSLFVAFLETSVGEKCMGMDAVRSIGLMRGDAINLISWRKFSVIRARRAGKVKSPPLSSS